MNLFVNQCSDGGRDLMPTGGPTESLAQSRWRERESDETGTRITVRGDARDSYGRSAKSAGCGLSDMDTATYEVAIVITCRGVKSSPVVLRAQVVLVTEDEAVATVLVERLRQAAGS